MGISRDDWLRALDEAHVLQPNDPEAVTVMEFAAMFDLDRQTAERRLRALVVAGKAVETLKHGVGRDGRRRNLLAFRLT